jgi:hypothetical protein
MRYPERPGSGRSRFGVRRCPPAPITDQPCGPIEQRHRPCGFPPDECDAGKLDMRTRRLRFRRPMNASHSCGGLTNLLAMCDSSAGHPCGRSSVQPTDHALTCDPSYQAPPLRTFAARYRSCALGMLFPGVPLPIRAFAAWPGVGSFPRFAGQRSWGSPAPFAGLLPHRVGDHLRSSGPTCLFVAIARPDWFSSGASIRSIEIEAARDWIGFWA